MIIRIMIVIINTIIAAIVVIMIVIMITVTVMITVIILITVKIIAIVKIIDCSHDNHNGVTVMLLIVIATRMNFHLAFASYTIYEYNTFFS